MSSAAVYVAFVVGLVLVIKGADWFVESAVWIAKRTRLPEILVGATIVSVGTTLPELSVSVYSSFVGFPDVALGNAIGSCICNIGLVFGASIAVRAVQIRTNFFYVKAVLMLAAAVLVTVLSMDGGLDKSDGALLVALLVGYIIYVVKTQRPSPQAETEREFFSSGVDASTAPRLFPNSTAGQIIQFAIGAAAVAIGSRFLVSSATTIADMMGISEKVVGLTIVAIGTSLPELATAVSAFIKGHQSLSAGNIVGANFINLTAVLGFSSIVNRVPIGSSSIIIDYPVMLALMGMLIIFSVTKRTLSRWEGSILLAAYVAYIVTLFVLG